MILAPELAEELAQLPLKGIQREYPNKLNHVLRSSSDLKSPKDLHPAFYGCYDWHSAVHGHWTLVFLLKHFELGAAAEIREVLDRSLSPKNLLRERDYFAESGHASFERPYGWAWLLQLAAVLRISEDHQMQAWASHLAPLEEIVAERFLHWFRKQSYPIRVGTHSNSAFALGLAFDYAEAVSNIELQRHVRDVADGYYAKDAGYPTWLEPSGDDFLSPCLVEADLMRRLMPPQSFAAWFETFLPEVGSIFDLPRVSDRDDPKIGHLDGLCLSKAWCLSRIAKALPPDHAMQGALGRAEQSHAQEGLKHVVSGNYLGEHWLATFAAYYFANS